jgi:uncharacterized repeat protein (TIGR03803 family)
MRTSGRALRDAMAFFALLAPFAAGAQTFSTVYAFGESPDGAKPNQLVYDGGRLYGTTSGGGAAGLGTVFEVTRTGGERVLYSFAGGSDGLIPYAGLARFGSSLYGTTVFGGGVCPGNGCGTIYRIDPRGSESVVYAFTGGNDGKLPEANLIDVGGELYGTTALGGSAGLGAVFRFAPDERKEAVVYSFAGGTDGQTPSAGLVRIGRHVYGTTAGGGAAGLGTVFSVDLDTGSETVLHAFSGTDGAQPLGALAYTGCKLYGTTFAGGATGNGTVFEIDPFSGSFRVVHSFSGTDGANPLAAVIEEEGRLYGTTFLGGAAGAGTVYRFDPRDGNLKTLYSFSGGEDGGNPAAPLISVGGELYGTTSKGGSSAGGGTVFRLSPWTQR